MALTPHDIATLVLRECKKKRLGNAQIRKERSPLIGRWLRERPWFLRDYPDHEAQAELYWQIEKELFRLTVPRKSVPRSKRGPRPHEDPRNLQLFK